MTIQEARLKIRKQRRKDIIQWYKYIKKRMNEPYSIVNGYSFSETSCIMFMPYCGQVEAARLFIYKNRCYELVNEMFNYKLKLK